MTRAELRRHSQTAADLAATPRVPLTRRSVRPRVSPDIAATETQTFELDEPVVEEVVEVVEPTVAAEQVVENPIDEFEIAARLFSFTGETPIQRPIVDADAEQDAAYTAHRSAKVRAPKRSRRATVTRIAATSFSLSAMMIVGMLTIGMTTPAGAVSPSAATGSVGTVPAGDVEVDPGSIQAYVAPAQVENVELDRAGNYGTESLANIASDLGIQNFSNFFTNDPTSNIQWPFSVGVPISYGFGMRPGGFHHGVDFTPGNGAEIQAIADGTVRLAQDGNGTFGVNVLIDHIIDGQLVSSHYAHMQHGSLRVHTGEKVKVGQILGLVGATGFAFGAHLHFEIWANGVTKIDPLPWLREYTDGTHTVG